MHFLSKLIETPLLDDPAKNYMYIHRHFYRYSKGDFIGPALRISKTSSKITLRGAHEYEDLINEVVTTSIDDPKLFFEIKGKLISGSDVSDLFNKLDLGWNLKKSTGQTKKYTTEINDKINKEKLLAANEAFRANCYFLISFSIDPSCKVITKKKIPQPSKKKMEEDDVRKRLQFCTGYIPNTEKNIKSTLNLTVSDFKSSLPNKWRSITILNNYKITDIKIPKRIKGSRLLRIMSIRKGKLFRSINVDGELYEKQYSIVV